MTGNSVSTAAQAARRFRVEQTDEGVILVDRQDAERRVQVRPTLVHLTIEARPVRICQSLVPGGLDRWLTLEVVHLSLGSEGDSSDLSVWADDEDDDYDAENSIFGIADADLVHLGVTHARVVDLEARGRYGHPYIERPTRSAPAAEDDVQNSAGDEEDEDQGPVADVWYHTGKDRFSGFGWSALVLTVGFPEPQFSELLDACMSGRADALVLECRCYAKTTASAFQSARDLILSAGESVRLHIAGATMSAPVLAGAPRSPAAENGENGGRAVNGSEWDQERNVNVPRVTAGAGPALLFTVAVSVLSALFGAGVVALLIIAMR